MTGLLGPSKTFRLTSVFRKYGIPQHNGMFYAMGFALVMEGLMSGSYHICPNHSNFQVQPRPGISL